MFPVSRTARHAVALLTDDGWIPCSNCTRARFVALKRVLEQRVCVTRLKRAERGYRPALYRRLLVMALQHKLLFTERWAPDMFARACRDLIALT